MQFRKSLFLFRRDLRLEDNTGLIFALQSSEWVIPAFIFTPEQIEKNPLQNVRCLQFMLESLQNLEEQLSEKKGKLFFFHGKPEEILLQCIQELEIDALIVNRDYTPYSCQRDSALEKVCKKHQIPFFSFEDALLHPPESTLKKSGTPYTVFTPYFRNASKLPVEAPVKNRWSNYFSGAISFAKKMGDWSIFSATNQECGLVGGRKSALKILKKMATFAQYARLKDFPGEDASTHLSPYLKFNVCSIREVYAAMIQHFSPQHPLIRALYWRDFFTSILFFFPHVLEGAFRPKFDTLQWSYHEKVFQQWCKGETGFPIVDAGMRELLATGFMQNRVRMITASFLVKDLHIDWRWGEHYFAKQLIDYDPAVNNGNWQWVASTGCDAQPYFRIFNPWSQQKKFDPDCVYIKKWIPELKHVPIKTIHAWHDEQHRAVFADYPAPMVHHETAIKKTLAMYRL